MSFSTNFCNIVEQIVYQSVVDWQAAYTEIDEAMSGIAANTRLYNIAVSISSIAYLLAFNEIPVAASKALQGVILNLAECGGCN
jgi:hypothetical protein